jgi:hypothetical protein
MTTIQIAAKEAYKIMRQVKQNFEYTHEILLFNGAKLIKDSNRRYHISGYHYAGKDTLDVITRYGVRVTKSLYPIYFV